MSDLKYWSNSAGGNTSAPPNGWPEGQSPASVNDCAREMMAAERRQWETAEWFDFNDTPSYATTSTFTVSGDRSTRYHVGRRIKAWDGANTFYGDITDVTYSTNTKVSVTLDSGEFTTSLTAIAVGILSFTNQSYKRVDKWDVSGTASLGVAIVKGTADISGTASIGAVVVGTTLSVSASASFKGTLDVSGTASFGAINVAALIPRGQLKTATAFGDGTVSASGLMTIALSFYAFFPQVYQPGITGVLNMQPALGSASLSALPSILLVNTSGSNRGYSYHYRYITASEGPKHALFYKDGVAVSKSGFTDAPPEWEKVFQSIVNANGWTYELVSASAFNRITF